MKVTAPKSWKALEIRRIRTHMEQLGAKWIGAWRTPQGCSVLATFEPAQDWTEVTDDPVRLAAFLSKAPRYLAHLSISHLDRYPTWEEQKEARYALFPEVAYMISVLPPLSQYVALHDNCFHWWEQRIGEPFGG